MSIAGKFRRRKTRFPRAPKGVMILEILVVMIILALLITLVAPTFLTIPEKAKADTTRVQIRSLSTALDLYRLHNSTYPTTEQGLEALVSKPEVGRIPTDWQGPYIKATRVPTDGWKNPFIYISDDGKSFEIISLGADGQEGGTDLDADVSSRDL